MSILNYGLLQYNYTDTNSIVANSTLANTSLTLLSYLSDNSVPLVASLPESVGVYCVNPDSGPIYNVYTVYLDGSVYVNTYQHSLRWINVIL